MTAVTRPAARCRLLADPTAYATVTRGARVWDAVARRFGTVSEVWSPHRLVVYLDAQGDPEPVPSAEVVRDPSQVRAV